MFNNPLINYMRATQNPIQGLEEAALAQTAPGGGVAATSPQPQAAPPAPASASSAGGGGTGALFAGLGDRLNRAMSGEGFFGGPREDDQEIDPNTGAPKGLLRRGQGQNMMKMGVMLMAAGMRQSPEQRAQILASIADTVGDNTDQINSFAQNRLNMAKLRLAEQEQLRLAQRQAAMDRLMGVDSSTGAGAAPSGAAAAPAPASFSPVPSGAAPGAPVGAPFPLAKADAAPAPAPAPMAAPAAQAPAGVMPEIGGAPVPIASLPTTPPKLPPIGRWTPTEADKMGYGLGHDAEAQSKFITDRIAEHGKQKRVTDPYYRPGVGMMIDIWQGDQKVDEEKLGDAEEIMRVIPGENGERIFQTLYPDGRVKNERREFDALTEARGKRQIERDIPLPPSGFHYEGNTLVPTPGGDPERERRLEDEKAAAAKAAEQGKAARAVEDTDKVLKHFYETKDDYFKAVGPAAGAMAWVPGSDAWRMSTLIEPLEAYTAIQTLQTIRQNSPTGGALGNVSDKDLELLKTTYGRLKAATDPADFEYNMQRFRNELMDITYGAGNGPPRVDLSRLPGAANYSSNPYDPRNMESVWTPEEKAKMKAGEPAPVAPVAPPPSATSSAPPEPGSDMDPDKLESLRRAKIALDKGVDRETVLQRLREAGVNVEGL